MQGPDYTQAYQPFGCWSGTTPPTPVTVRGMAGVGHMLPLAQRSPRTQASQSLGQTHHCQSCCGWLLTSVVSDLGASVTEVWGPRLETSAWSRSRL